MSLDTKRAFTPATVEWSGILDKHGDKIYMKENASDHKAIEVELAVDIAAPRRSVNIPVIDYNNKEGWTRYRKLSDKYVAEIRTIIKKNKDKNERQDAFKEMIHKLEENKPKII